MNRREYLDLLRMYLRSFPEDTIDEIIRDYDEHFRIGLENGKTEEEIAKELGAPSFVASEYMDSKNFYREDKEEKEYTEEKLRDEFEKIKEKGIWTSIKNTLTKSNWIIRIIIILAFISFLNILPSIFGLIIPALIIYYVIKTAMEGKELIPKGESPVPKWLTIIIALFIISKLLPILFSVIGAILGIIILIPILIIFAPLILGLVVLGFAISLILGIFGIMGGVFIGLSKISIILIITGLLAISIFSFSKVKQGVQFGLSKVFQFIESFKRNYKRRRDMR